MMKKERLFLILLAVSLSIALFSLPRVVVDNEQNSTSVESNPPASAAISDDHDHEFSESEKNLVESLREKRKSAQSIEKSIIFADSLESLFSQHHMYDSAAKYVEWIVKRNSGINSIRNAASVYFSAFRHASSPAKSSEYGEKARSFFQELLNKSDFGPDSMAIINTNIALTHISSDNPMQGIAMLRQVLEENPNNEYALLNMGLLSIQSGQYDRAIERFEELISINPDNIEGRFYLGVSFFEKRDMISALKHFNYIKENPAPEELKTAAAEYLKEINS